MNTPAWWAPRVSYERLRNALCPAMNLADTTQSILDPIGYWNHYLETAFREVTARCCDLTYQQPIDINIRVLVPDCLMGHGPQDAAIEALRNDWLRLVLGIHLDNRRKLPPVKICGMVVLGDNDVRVFVAAAKPRESEE